MKELPAIQTGLERLVGLSPFSADIMARYPQLLDELRTSGRLARRCGPTELRELLEARVSGSSGDDELIHRLRLFRHRELLRIIWRDLNEGVDVTESLRDLSDLADAAINAALKFADDLLR
ncbi:MAG: bifunctional glutamine synthetase adenylyltransferase/deadenyltransferase, partial [Gammaproteobacteria bacterium]